MAKADQIKALIKSHLAGDEQRFYAIAMQIAAHSARQGHGRVASEIKALIDEAKGRASRHRSPQPIPIATPRGDLAGLLAVSYPDTCFSEMVLKEETDTRLRKLLREHRAQGKLRSFGLVPRRKLLLVGPPGTGKTMTASALAGELHLPLYVIVLDGLITKYMGETAAKLRLVFDAIAEKRGVYLFDEFDAIGGERWASQDVGEIRRVLNSFLQFIEQDDSDSIVVAATNHRQSLDPALFRRFDDVVRYELPSGPQAEQVLRNCLAMFPTKEIDWAPAVEAASDLSHAEITKAALSAAKDAILDDLAGVTTELLIIALEERRRHQFA